MRSRLLAIVILVIGFLLAVLGLAWAINQNRKNLVLDSPLGQVKIMNSDSIPEIRIMNS